MSVYLIDFLNKPFINNFTVIFISGEQQPTEIKKFLWKRSGCRAGPVKSAERRQGCKIAKRLPYYRNHVSIVGQSSSDILEPCLVSVLFICPSLHPNNFYKTFLPLFLKFLRGFNHIQINSSLPQSKWSSRRQWSTGTFS